MSTKKNILFVITEFGSGGAEKSLQTLLNNLDYTKYNVDLFPVVTQGTNPIKFNDNVNIIEGFSSWDELNNSFKTGYHNTLLHAKLKPIYDVQVSYMEGISALIVTHYGNASSKKIAWIHSDISISLGIINAFNYEYHNMDKIVIVSEGSRKAFLTALGEDFNSKCITLYNPLDKDLILNKSYDYINFTKNKVTLLSIGRLAPEKRFDRLIHVHKQLLNEGLDHDLIILGNGVQKQILDNLILDLEVSSTCKLFGFVENPYPWINMCDIFVSSSQAESCPIVITESMVLCKPIVATKTVGSVELLEDNLGLLVDNSDDGLFAGLKLLIESSELRSYYSSNLSNLKLFDIESTMSQIDELFNMPI